MSPTTTARKPAAPTWDLDSIFPGGSKSTEYKIFREKTVLSLEELGGTLTNLQTELNDSSAESWKKFLLGMQTIMQDLELLISFASCLSSQNVNDMDAIAIESEGDLFVSQFEKIRTGFEALAMRQPDDEWKKLLADDDLIEVSFYLNEMRDQAKMKMSVEKESLALDLAVNGYHAWNRLYDKMGGDLKVSFTENGESKILSLGQVASKDASSDRKIREQAFDKMTEAWKTQADLAAMTLNAQAGFRLSLYKQRGWDSYLYEPLAISRLNKESLDAMWAAISKSIQKLSPYIEAKKSLLGIDKFRWYDQSAPCGDSDKSWVYDNAANFIVDNVRGFSDDLADFCRNAIDKNWIEAEDRPSKRGGGFCTGTGALRESRIFMTYSDTYDDLLTLAHELGHAYHSHVLKDTPYFATIYPMTLAETASIFSEMLVTDAALSACDKKQEKIMLIDQKIQQAFVFFCNIYCRYLFECKFYEERQKGVINQDGLCELMSQAQREAFGPLLDESGMHPYFWASKLHFFFTDYPFYNYPYTFGYLFAGGVYDRARSEGSSFSANYKSLLADTGKMTSEQVAQKHMGVDLTKPDFWESAVARSLSDVDEFVSLVKSVSN